MLLLSDWILGICLGLFVFGIAFGWVLLIILSLVKWVLPKKEFQIEIVSDYIFKTLGFTQKYSIYIGLTIIVTRLIAAYFGLTPPIFTSIGLSINN